MIRVASFPADVAEVRTLVLELRGTVGFAVGFQDIDAELATVPSGATAILDST